MDISPALLLPDFRWVERAYNIQLNGVTAVSNINPNRVAWVWSCNSGADIYVSPFADIAVGNGIFLPMNGSTVILTFAQLGAVIGQQWYATSAGTIPAWAMEVVFQPQQET